MPYLEFSAVFDAPRETVWAFYDDIENLPRITPPPTRVWIPNKPERIEQGTRFDLLLFLPPFPVPIRWETVIVEHDAPHFFVDTQGAHGPFGFWHHTHHFDALPDERTRLRDCVTYDPPLGTLGLLADEIGIRRQLTAMFRYRHRKTRELLKCPLTPLPPSRRHPLTPRPPHSLRRVPFPPCLRQANEGE